MKSVLSLLTDRVFASATAAQERWVASFRTHIALCRSLAAAERNSDALRRYGRSDSDFPAAQYARWRSIEMTFDPEGMGTN